MAGRNKLPKGYKRETVQILVQGRMVEKFGQRKLNQIAVQAIEKEFMIVENLFDKSSVVNLDAFSTDTK